MSNLSDTIGLSDHETSQIEQTRSLKKQTSLDSFLLYKSVTESEGFSPEESDNDIISEQYKISAEASSPSTISHSLQIPVKRKNKIPIYRKTQNENWVWYYTERNKVTKLKYCKVNINNGNENIERCTTIFQPSTSVTNIASHLHTVHRIFKNQKLDVSIVSSSENRIQTTINSIFEKHTEITQPLSKVKQSV
ncbi:11971_t:CDS:1 [Racocetra persica]|uniref:11971_t:CDS:1 n=1 Tax=Racocetra persica TaxID=160502 RepID=A0ACA9LIB3_9GLOM|nr:11971_t:CDS:1 [Racocetra persica]